MVVHLNLRHSNYEWRGCKDPALTFLPQRNPCETRETSLAGVFHLKGKEKGKLEKNSGRETSLDEEKGEMKMDEDEKG